MHWEKNQHYREKEKKEALHPNLYACQLQKRVNLFEEKLHSKQYNMANPKSTWFY